MNEMKRNLFFIINSIFLFTVIGIGMQSCSDDDDKKTGTEAGDKTIELFVVDENDQSVIADVTIWRNGDSIKVVQVSGSYIYDVSDEANNTKFEFMAKRPGYISSEKKSVTLEYTGDCHCWKSDLTLMITQQSESFVVDQSETSTIRFTSYLDSERNVDMTIPARATDLQYLEISPTFVPTASSKGLLSRDAPNGTPALQILSIESDWDEVFNDGKTVTITFPLTQAIVDAVRQHGISLVFGTTDNATHTWESYPVTVDQGALTGTVQIPHFSVWYLTIGSTVTYEASNSLTVLLGTSACGLPVTVTYNQANLTLDKSYTDLFGLRNLSSVTQSYTAAAVSNMQVTVQAHCTQVNIAVSGTGVSFVYYQPPVVFSTIVSTCGSHVGGGGQ